MDRFGPSRVCPECGRDLNANEICCDEDEKNFQEMMQEAEDDS